MNTAAIAVGAVHVAFDAHDTIDMMMQHRSDSSLQCFQGTTYSGIHYKLLASLPDFSFIRTFLVRLGELTK